MFFRNMRYALIWALFILILCGIPGKDIPHISFLELLSFDKFVHASIFFILTLLLIRGFSLQQNPVFLKTNPKLVSLIVSIIYGGLLEIMQGTIFEGRSASIFDFIANSFGSGLGFVFFSPINRKLLWKLP